MSTVPTKEELRRKLEAFVQETDLTNVTNGNADIAWEYAGDEYVLYPLSITAPWELKHRGEIAFSGEGMGDLLNRDEDGELVVTENDLEEVKKLLLNQADDIAEELYLKLMERTEAEEE